MIAQGIDRMFYFGCYGQAGHYVRRSPHAYELEDRRRVADFLYTNPWGMSIDGGLCPSGSQIEGAAILRQKDGWTALSFWDRSVDHRMNSNSNFFAKGSFDFKEMIELAISYFPDIVSRYRFKIVQVPSEEAR